MADLNKTIWQHLNNLAIFILSGAAAAFASLILEYEYAKHTSPMVEFIKTVYPLDIILAIPAVLLGIINLAMLFIISAKKLPNRWWLWISVLIQLILVGIIWYKLGNEATYHIIFPSASFLQLKK